MSYAFTLVKPVLVWELSAEEKTVLEQHGCVVEAYPNEKYLLGHMVTFPPETTIEMRTTSLCPLYFPDGYQSMLVWVQNWYHVEAEQGNALQN